MPAPAPPPRSRRLGSLRNSSLIGKPKATTPTPAPTPAPAAATKQTCCDEPKIEDDGEGRKLCRNCFTQLSENTIVAEITFAEDSRGAATVQGGFVGENATHASTLGHAISRAAGANDRNTAQEVERNARKSLDKLCPRLGVSESTRAQAVSIFSLASRSRFSAGRRTDEVAAACLYAACRRQRDNTIMLMDISELLNMNVFRLGEVYKALCKELMINDQGGVGTQYLVEVESLIMKYCRKLEFGEATRQVAEDAVKIVRRMKRDWMVTGRHPAGLCGACIILAARMNNFRRSTREVVYVAKVADMTIMKRVNEFRRTKAAALTVDQFREFGVRLKHQNDPPVLYETELKRLRAEEKKRKRDAASTVSESPEANEGDPRSASREISGLSATPGEVTDEGDDRRKRQRLENGGPATPPSTQQEPRRDADGFVIPPLPNEQSPESRPQNREQQQEDEQPRRGRRKRTPPPPVIITEEELVEEQELEDDINDNLNDDEVIDSRNEIEKAKDEERARQLADREKLASAERNKARRQAEGITWVGDRRAPEPDEEDDDDLEAQFANDPEVQNCILSDAEQRVKEQIWLLHNEDWLRSQQEKKLLESIAKSVGRDAKGRKKGTKITKRKRKGKMGDGTTLAEAGTPIETPADANRIMMEKRGGNFSKFLNWDVLNKVFEQNSSKTASSRGTNTPNNGASTGTTPPSRERTGAQQSSSSPTPDPRSEALGLATPPSTNRVAAGAAPRESPERESATPTPAPPTPQQNQGLEDEDMVADDFDYQQDDDLDYGSDTERPFWGQEDDRESIGEDDDWQSAVRRTGNVSYFGDYMDDEEY
jgi:transcription factor IIIB 90 kDa subunit